MKKIEELKDLFVGPKTLLYAKAITDLSKATIDITADLELPVEVDSLKATMEDPTINHYKVIGLAGDWATTSELGDFNVEFVVPSKAKDLLAAMFGNDAVSELTKVTLKTGDTELDATTGFTGVALELKKFKIQGTIAIVDDTKTNVMVITNIALYATLQWDETGTKPVAFKFSGSIEGAGKKSIAWLTKAAAA
ncbi:hypothetical protein [Leyella stercorea]|uniref:hypothetical protein n=1 Tax=Leyella stercorea TaxID=363265 RepID=UPI001A42D470|nr:hypothetical protein [Leyella stercorea]MBL6517345.1 hypothetical protein [Leyella stercorea]